MAVQKVNFNDLFSDNLSTEIVNLQKLINKTDAEIQKLVSTAEQFAKIKFNPIGSGADAQSINENTEALKKLTAQIDILQKEYADLKATQAQYLSEEQKATEAAKQATEAAKQRTEEAKRAREEQTKNIAAQKEAERQAKANQKATELQAGSLAELRKKLSELNKEYVAMGAAERNAGAGKELLNKIKATSDEVKKLEGEMGLFQRNVGNYKSAWDGVGSTILKVGGTIGGVVTVITGIYNAVKNAISGIMEFEKSVSNLSAITGAVGSDLAFFRIEAINAGKDLGVSAKDMIEAMKLIGSAKPELLKSKEGLVEVTKAAVRLSQAATMELPEAAAKLTDAMNQFGAPASEAAKYVDILAVASQAGAAEIPQVTEALLKFGAVASGANINIKESAAAIELLADKGIKGAEAGTALRNIFLALSSADVLPKSAKTQMEKHQISTKVLMDSTLSLELRLKEMAKAAKDSSAMVEIFGKENVTAASVVLNNLGRYKELANAMNTTGVAAMQAQMNMNNLSGDVTKLGSKWDSFLLSLDSGEGVLSKIVRGTVQFGAAVLDVLTPTQDLTKELKNEQQEVNTLAAIVASAGTPMQARNEAYAKLMQLAPEVLKGIQLESVDMVKLTDNLRAYNNEIMNKILLTEEDEKIKKEGVTTASKYREMYEASETAAKHFAKVEKDIFEYTKSTPEEMKKLNEAKKMGLATYGEELVKLQRKYGQVLGDSNVDTQKLLVGNAELTRSQVNNLRKYTNEFTDQTKKQTDAQLKKEALMKSLGVTDTTIAPITTGGGETTTKTTGGGGMSDKQKKDAEKAAKDAANLQKELDNLRIKAITDGRTKQEEEDKKWYNENLKKFEDSAEGTLIIEGIYREKRNQTKKEWDKKDNEQSLKAFQEQQRIEKMKFETSTDTTLSAFAANPNTTPEQMATAKDTVATKKAIFEKQQAEDLLNFLKKNGEDTVAAEAAVAKYSLDIQTKLTDGKAEEAKKEIELEKEKLKRIEEIKKEFGGGSDEEKMEKELKDLEALGLAKLGMTEENEKAKAEIVAKYEDKKRAKVQKALNDTKTVLSTGSQFVQTLKDMELKAIEDKEAQGVISKEEAEKQKKEISKKYADSEFAMKIIQIGIDTASGIMSAMSLPTPLNWIQAGLVTAMGIAQTVIANRERQKLKALAKGEINIDGEGTETSDSIPAMLSKGESVMTAKDTKKALKTLKNIHEGKWSDKDIIPAMSMFYKIGGIGMNKIPENMIIVSNNFVNLEKISEQNVKELKEIKKALQSTESKDIIKGLRVVKKDNVTTIEL